MVCQRPQDVDPVVQPEGVVKGEGADTPSLQPLSEGIVPLPNSIIDNLPEGGLATQTDPPLFRIDYLRLAKTTKKIGEKKVFELIKEAYLTGRIDARIKRVLLRLTSQDRDEHAR